MRVVHSMNVIPWSAQPKKALSRKVNQVLTAAKLPDRVWDLVVAYDPFSVPLISRLRYDALVYDCVDAYDHQPQYADLASAATLKRAETRVAEMANVRVATSSILAARRASDWGLPVEVLEGAHELEPQRINVRENQGVRALYVGAFDSYKIDARVITAWLDADNRRSLVMAGKPLAGVDADLNALLKRDRVRVTHPVGAVQFRELARNADVGLVALQPTPYNTYSFPLKTWDYFMNGLPVLSSKAPSISRVPGVYPINSDSITLPGHDPNELVQTAMNYHVDMRLKRLVALL